MDTFTPNQSQRPSVTVDVILMTVDENDLKILLVKRGLDPYAEQWALPGGFVRMEESLENAALRELKEETGVKNVYLEQLYTFGDPKRDPRTRVITVSYFALTSSKNMNLKASTDATEVNWFSLKKLPKLAFDHKKIVTYAVNRLKAKIAYSNIAFGLLPEKFRLSELQKIYEIILSKKMDKRNFRKWILSQKLLESTGEKAINGAHRPAELYRFKKHVPIFFD